MSVAGNSTVAPAAPGKADPRAYARILWRWKFVLIAFVVIIPLATYFVERGRPKVYQSSALLEVTGGQQTGVASLFNQVVQQGPDTTDLFADARLITTGGMAELAAKYLQPTPANPRSLLGDINAKADQTTGFITLTASGSTPQAAANTANAFSQAIVSNQTQAAARAISTAITQLQRQLAALANNDPSRAQVADQLARFRALQAAQSSNVQIIDGPTRSSTPVAPRVTRSVILALMVALLLGLGAVALAETTDRRIRHPDEAGDSAGLPLLGSIPASAFSSAKRSPQAEESFATLRASLTYFNVDRRIATVLVTSPGKEDGKTTVATRLAQALTRGGKNVILLDADLRRPAVASRLGIPPSAGLPAVLVGEVELDEALVEYQASNGRPGSLRVLPAGPPAPNPSELLGSRRMRELISELEERSDIVLIDSSPLLTVSDSMAVVRAVSGVMLIARVNHTSREAIRRLREVVDSAGGNALGVVATAAASGGLYVAAGYGYETAYASTDAPASGGLIRGRIWRRGADVAAGQGTTRSSD
jgi:capsular exopolysaccharide synthesis family protein